MTHFTRVDEEALTISKLEAAQKPVNELLFGSDQRDLKDQLDLTEQIIKEQDKTKIPKNKKRPRNKK